MPETFREALTLAMEDFALHGYDSPPRLEYWMGRLRDAAVSSLRPEFEMEEKLREALGAIYRKAVERGQILARHPGVGRFDLARLAPQLRSVLDRQILASASLIRLNREQAIESTLRRFAGWSTSVPAGGSKAPGRGEEAAKVRKSMSGLSFVERRVLIDQSQKLRASLSETIAQGTGALACVWHSHWKQPGYHFRPEHKARDDKVYAVRDNWAIGKGLMKVGPDGYYDEITSAGSEVYCRCFVTWINSLGRLPDEMLTSRGRTALASVRAEMARR